MTFSAKSYFCFLRSHVCTRVVLEFFGGVLGLKLFTTHKTGGTKLVSRSIPRIPLGKDSTLAGTIISKFNKLPYNPTSPTTKSNLLKETSHPQGDPSPILSKRANQDTWSRIHVEGRGIYNSWSSHLPPATAAQTTMSHHDAGPNRRRKPQPGEPNRYEIQIEAASDERQQVERRIFLQTVLIFAKKHDHTLS